MIRAFDYDHVTWAILTIGTAYNGEPGVQTHKIGDVETLIAKLREAVFYNMLVTEDDDTDEFAAAAEEVRTWARNAKQGAYLIVDNEEGEEVATVVIVQRSISEMLGRFGAVNPVTGPNASRKEAPWISTSSDSSTRTRSSSRGASRTARAPRWKRHSRWPQRR